jgi:hypothetical protein
MSDRPEPLTINCCHGTLTSAVVCRHHLSKDGRAVGFVENVDDPNNLQAWCGDCEAFFLREGGMTEEFVQFNDFALVCVVCYAEIKARHSTLAGYQ